MANVEVDTSDFDNKMKEYMAYSKRTIPEIITTKLYFIGRNATLTTKTTPKPQIRTELLRSSRINNKAPVAAIIVNTKNGKKGKLGLNGSKMSAAVEKLIRQRERATNFLRSGWLAAVKKIAPYVVSKAGQPPVATGVRPMGNFGGATLPLPRDNWIAEGEMWNSVIGGKNINGEQHIDKVQNILQKGLSEAIAKEVASMERYIQDKLDKQEAAFNK